MTLRVLITGATGRMGRELLRYGLELHQKGKIRLVAGIVSQHNPACGQDIAGLLGMHEPTNITCNHELATILKDADVVIDFTKPDYSLEIAALCARQTKIHVCGTTGLTPAQHKQLQSHAKRTRMLWSTNMSLTINLLAHLVRECASKLGPDFDIEILEMHHRHKVDAPSGTAIMLGQAAAEGRNTNLEQQAVWTRNGHTGPREPGTIGFATLRGGSVVGEHSVIFASEDEHLVLNHKSFDRRLYVPSTYRAALWLAQQPIGRLYTMADVLGY